MEITEFKTIKLHLSGMRFSDDYEIVCEGENTTVTEYQRGLRDNEHTTSVTRATNEVLDVLNKCGVVDWDGFYGPHPDDVQDGVMFNLRAKINGKSIRAEGSENFPPHFHEFTEFIYKALR